MHMEEAGVQPVSPFPEGKAWRAKLPDIPKLGRPLKVALPCVGIDGCTHALKILDTDFQPTNVYDVERGYDDLLRQHYESANSPGTVVLNTGASGDICSADFVRLEKPDALCSGPPCPPWAGLGNKGSQNDPRARVFERVLQWVMLFIKTGSLLFCVLENVPGILHRIKGQPSFMSRVLTTLQEECSEFSWEVFRMKATDYGLPQSRIRVFLIGVRRALFGERVPPPMPPWGRNPQLKDFLSFEAANTARDSLTPNMKANLTEHEHRLKAMLRRGALNATDIISVCLDRAYGKVFKPRFYTNKIPTLTTNNQYIFLMSLDFGKPDHARALFRWLLPAERFILQGFPVECAQQLPRSLQVKACGNAYPVPLMAAALTPIVQELHGKIDQWPMPSGTVDAVPRAVYTLNQKLRDAFVVEVIDKKRPARAKESPSAVAKSASKRRPMRASILGQKSASAISISSASDED